MSTATMLPRGLEVINIYSSKVGVIEGPAEFNNIHGEAYYVRFSKKKSDVEKVFLKVIRPVTPEESIKARAWSFIDKSDHSRYLKVYISLLRKAGSVGIMNDCRCSKSSIIGYEDIEDVFGNRACSCATLVKLGHRFSTCKDELRKVGFEIEDITTENGIHKTILHKEP